MHRVKVSLWWTHLVQLNCDFNCRKDSQNTASIPPLFVLFLKASEHLVFRSHFCKLTCCHWIRVFSVVCFYIFCSCLRALKSFFFLFFFSVTFLWALCHRGQSSGKELNSFFFVFLFCLRPLTSVKPSALYSAHGVAADGDVREHHADSVHKKEKQRKLNAAIVVIKDNLADWWKLNAMDTLASIKRWNGIEQMSSVESN